MKFIFNVIRLIYVGSVLLLSGLLLRLLLMALVPQLKPRLKVGLGSHISKVAEFLGPSYIKLGQFLSTRPDLIGFKMADQLSKLQDRLKPIKFAKVKRHVTKALNADIEDVFAEFSEEAKAAASIAQVHYGRLHSGQEVAVKILRPGVEKVIKADISLFYMMAKIAQFLSSHCKRMQLYQVVKRLEEMVQNELDLRMEAASADMLRDNLKSDRNIIIPEIYWQFTSQKLMLSKWCHGVPANDLKAVAQLGINIQKLVQKLAVTVFNQAFRDGFFHADLHPGNMLITNEGKIVLLDFGIMGYLDEESRVFIADMFHGFITRDYDKVARLHFEVGYVPKDQSFTLFALACRSIGEPIVGKPVNQISIAALMKQLFEISDRFNIKLQPQLILLQKTLVVVEGVGYSLFPEVNMWKMAEPWIKSWGRQNLSAAGKAKRLVGQYAKIVAELPATAARLEKIIDHFEKRLDKKVKGNAI